MEEVTDIRLQDLKESIVQLRIANNSGNRTLVDTYCMIAAQQLKSLEYNLKGTK
jgi:hypothetical protein